MGMGDRGWSCEGGAEPAQLRQAGEHGRSGGVHTIQVLQSGQEREHEGDDHMGSELTLVAPRESR